MTDKRALVRLYMLAISNQVQLAAIDQKLNFIFRACGIADHSIAEIQQTTSGLTESILRKQLDQWRPFFEQLADGEDLSDLSFDDLMKM